MDLNIAVDFGETWTAVSWHAAAADKTVPKDLSPCDINTVFGYPSGFEMGKSDTMRLEVPTQLLYPRGWRFRPLDELWGAPPGSINTLNGKSESPDSRLRWGYQVSQDMSRVSFQSNMDGTLVYRFKTLMDQSENHKQHKRDLEETLRLLSMNRTCQKEIPIEEMVQLVTIDYLTKLLEFVKVHILNELNTSTIVTTKMTICVPIIWSQKAIRNMQLCMGLAAKLVDFPGIRLLDKSMDNVFIMAEPEAGATWVLPNYSSRFKLGDTILVLDIGGGTLDAQTFSIAENIPLRLGREAIRYSGDSCGSNALNEAVFEHVLELLDEHEYLEDQPGVTREGIARKIAFHDFETFYKKYRDMVNEPNCNFEVPGIRYDPNFPHDRNPKPNNLTILSSKITAIFHNVCENVENIMIKQVETALKKGIEIKEVVLMGGFALSPFLYRRLDESLKHHRQMNGHTCQIFRPNSNRGMTLIDAVAAGAVMRALNKEKGPKRVTKTAYGLAVYVPYEKKLHMNQKPIDGIQNPREKWIKTIQWVSKLGEEIPPMHEESKDRFCQFPCEDSNEKRIDEFKVRDEIYLSDFSSEDNQSIDHERNQGAEPIGIIESDVTHLAHTFLHQRVKGPGRHKSDGHAYWEFHYELVYQIDGLNMRCIQRRGEEVLGELGMNIASALPSGAA